MHWLLKNGSRKFSFAFARSCEHGFAHSCGRACAMATVCMLARAGGRLLVCSLVMRDLLFACGYRSYAGPCGRAFARSCGRARVLARHERPVATVRLLETHSFASSLFVFKTFVGKVNISTTKTIVKSVIAIFAPENEVPNARQLKCRQSNPHFHLEGSCTSQGTKDCQMLNSYAVQTTGKMTCVL